MTNDCKRIRKKAFHIFFVLIIIQAILFNLNGYIYKESEDNNKTIVATKEHADNVLIADTVRSQQRTSLQAIRQSWIQYLQTHPSSLVKKTDNKVIYSNGKITVYYDEDLMYKKQTTENLFDIYSKSTNSKIAAGVRPQWNNDEVLKILNIIAAPIKTFGNHSSILIFDSYTGEVLMDTSSVNRASIPEYSIFKDYENPSNKNPEESKIVVDQDFVVRKDTDRVSSIVYMFNEPTKMGSNANNFEQYPLGKYNRLFVEKAVLPYETIGVDGQPMQLTMSIMTDEQDIVSPYSNVTASFNNYIENNNKIFGKTTLILIVSTLLSMSSTIVSLYVLKTQGKCNITKTSDEGEGSN